MTGKELIQATYRHEAVERPAWVPYAGIHAAKFKGYTATEILKDEDKLVECLMEVHRLYRPDGQPIAFDLQLEAEIPPALPLTPSLTPKKFPMSLLAPTMAVFPSL